jgi:hypothetical protein
MLGTHKITGANAGGPRQLPMRTRRAARVAQFCRWRCYASRVMKPKDPEYVAVHGSYRSRGARFRAGIRLRPCHPEAGFALRWLARADSPSRMVSPSEREARPASRVRPTLRRREPTVYVGRPDHQTNHDGRALHFLPYQSCGFRRPHPSKLFGGEGDAARR